MPSDPRSGPHAVACIAPVIAVLFFGCTPPECLPDEPVKLGAVLPGLTLKPELGSVTLIPATKPLVRDPLPSGYSCPSIDFTDLTGVMGDAPLRSTASGGPLWDPDFWYGDAQKGDGQCVCQPAVMKTEDSTPRAVSSDRLDLTLTQGSTRIRARYLNVSNSVQVTEEKFATRSPNERWYRFSSGFDRTYFVSHLDRNGTSVRAFARYGETLKPVKVFVSTMFVEVTLEGAPDELVFETSSIYHDVQPSECEGAKCEALRVFAPDQTLTVQLLQ
jgi:hypothetical protein